MSNIDTKSRNCMKQRLLRMLSQTVFSDKLPAPYLIPKSFDVPTRKKNEQRGRKQMTRPTGKTHVLRWISYRFPRSCRCTLQGSRWRAAASAPAPSAGLPRTARRSGPAPQTPPYAERWRLWSLGQEVSDSILRSNCRHPSPPNNTRPSPPHAL